jgi:Redoxin
LLPRSERTGRFSTALQAAANVATLIAACLLSIVLVKNYLLSGSARQQPIVRPPITASVSVGDSLKSQLPDVDWSANRKTVLLALSTHCHFCTESAPFLQQLSHRSGKAFKIVAVLPESVTAAQDYLKREGVQVDQLRQMPLDKLGVDGTPTMLLLNSNGTVMQSWVGKLDSEEQSRALKVIGGSQL